jgi:hypothetical protein
MPATLEKPKKASFKEANIADVFLAVLSYRTPMRIREMLVLSWTSYYRCPRCEKTLDREFMRYCDRCGQCLDWKGYQNALKMHPGEIRGK